MERAITIINPEHPARRSIITPRLPGPVPEGIRILSCSTPQPWIARQFEGEDMVGGMVITDGRLRKVLAVARERGWTLEFIGDNWNL